MLKITIELKDLMKQFYASLTDGCVESNESLDKFSTFLHLFSSIWQHFPSIKICTSLEKDFCDSLLLLFSNFSIKKLPRRFLSYYSFTFYFIHHIRCISPILCFIDLMEKEKRMEHRQSLFKNNIENIKVGLSLVFCDNCNKSPTCNEYLSTGHQVVRTIKSCLATVPTRFPTDHRSRR